VVVAGVGVSRSMVLVVEAVDAGKLRYKLVKVTKISYLYNTKLRTNTNHLSLYDKGTQRIYTNNYRKIHKVNAKMVMVHPS